LDGFIVIDKPKGPTSHQIDFWLREIVSEKKVGHIGTLDPGASGVLVMALGAAVKLIDIAHEFPKEYIAVMKLHGDFDVEKLSQTIHDFTSEIWQIPPMRSAVARNLRKRKIHEMEIMEISERDVLLRIKCESGTYIRTLCTDIGYMVCFGGQMAELRRTLTGPFTESNACTLQDVSDAFKLRKEGNEELWSRVFLPMDFLFRDTPKIVVKNSAIDNLSHGSDLFPGGIKAFIGNPRRNERVVLISDSNKLIATGTMLVSYDEIADVKVVDVDRVLVEPTGRRNDEHKPEVVGDRKGREKRVLSTGKGKVQGNFRSNKVGQHPGNSFHKGRGNTRPQRPPNRVRRIQGKKGIHT
jgi:tRNA pseudouridine55 synthase/H/ACA ribonucleoprotein complex subunit 4